MLSFLHPYVAVIIDFIESIDDFMEKNGGEFNSYVLSIMLIVIGYAKFIQKAKKAKGLNQKTQGKLELFAGVNLLLPSKMQMMCTMSSCAPCVPVILVFCSDNRPRGTNHALTGPERFMSPGPCCENLALNFPVLFGSRFTTATQI